MKSFHLCAVTGLVATSGANGALLAVRLPLNAPRRVYFERVRLRAMMTTPPTATQEFALQMHEVSAMTANPTGGTDLSDLTGAGAANYAIRATYRDVQRTRISDQIPTSVFAAGNIMVATTTALTVTGAARAQPFLRGHDIARLPADIAAGAPWMNLFAEWSPQIARSEYTDPIGGCLPIVVDDTGLVVSTPVAIGAALVVRACVELEWLEE